MKTKFTILAVFLNFAITQSIAQSTVDKHLQAELKRHYKSESFMFKEIDAPTKYNIAGKFYKIDFQGENSIKYVYSGRVNTNRGSNKSSTNNDFFDYFIFYNPEFTVLKVKIYNMQSSHGEGVASAGWLKQFVGYNGKKMLAVGKNIDAIAGATISTNNLTFDIQSKTKILSEMVK